MPAAAMITPKPLLLAFAENSIAASGVLCALITWTSNSTPNSFSFFTAFDTTGKSLSDPIIIATFFIISSFVYKIPIILYRIIKFFSIANGHF